MERSTGLHRFPLRRGLAAPDRVGWSGHVHVAVGTANVNQVQSEVVSFDSSTGAQDLHSLHFTSVGGIWAYAARLIVDDGGMIDYYHYAGSLVHSYPTTAGGDYGNATALGANGDIFVSSSPAAGGMSV